MSGEDNFDPTEILLNAIALTHCDRGVRGQKFSKNLGHKHANAPNVSMP